MSAEPSIDHATWGAERRAATLAGGQFFLILTAIMVLRPARESLGLSQGIDQLKILWYITLLATLLVAPLFSILVGALVRGRAVAWGYRASALGLLVFFIVLMQEGEASDTARQAYYVFHSVFNLFVVSLFWALLADGFGTRASKRWFARIAVGGTLGALAGPLIAGRMATHVGTEWVLPAAALLLVTAGEVVRWLDRRLDDVPGGGESSKRVGGSPIAVVRDLVRSPYLLGICGLAVFASLGGALLYFAKLRLVDAADTTLDENTVIFANIDLVTQGTTLLLQAFVAGWIMRRLGVGIALALLPIVAVIGFAVLAARPTLLVVTIFNAVYKAVQRAIMRPSRETLFTVTSREARYKTKTFIDTFVYRGGDAVGARVETSLIESGMTAASAALPFVIPLSAAWATVALLLGRRQRTLAREDEAAPPPMDQSADQPASIS